ncbi:GntR family transcriptional regulator [Teichococcus cervicalis]|uniref:Transcriptional regulator, GntR family n=1 Tax=Pseudoroseomonas cervicalis ATCC 49957 TaxID=525371 RepID=D5RJ14_9PROT|nr:GntR family transcriptional regulator [Pseudoroseomonas cervicalis]EFH12708.1 transcriptional regulator, GntR family [Pseudoroseomonas cervicalis ATCC 49957]
MAEPARDDTPTALPAAIAAALEEDIVFGRLHPRERLVEEELTARFRATRHAIRQALSELERMGLVERIPNRGALVKAYSLAEVEQLYALRALLEREAARQMPLPPPEAALAALRAVQAAHDRAVAEGDARAAFRANLAFHRAFFGCCGNAFLAETIEHLALRAHAIRFAAVPDPAALARAQEEHHAMLAALAGADRDALLRLCEAHLVPSRQAYLRAQAAFLA